MTDISHKYKNTFVSDVHIGHRHATPSAFISFLKGLDTQHLYVVGDGPFDTVMFRGHPHQSKPEHTQLVSSALSHARTTQQIANLTILSGNHNPEIIRMLRKGHQTYQPDMTLQYADASLRDTLKPAIEALREAHIHTHTIIDNILVMHGDIGGGWICDTLCSIGKNLTAAGIEPIGYPNEESLRKKQRIAEKMGFYRGLARTVRHHQARGLIHGHIHAPGTRIINGIPLVCLPDWLNHSGGALVQYPNDEWAFIDNNHNVTRSVPELSA